MTDEILHCIQDDGGAFIIKGKEEAAGWVDAVFTLLHRPPLPSNSVQPWKGEIMVTGGEAPG